MRVLDRHFIGGEWTKVGGDGGVRQVVDSSSELATATLSLGTKADAERAVLAARSAFDAWAARPIDERASLVAAIADGLHARREELARDIASEVGMPIKLTQMIQVDGPIRTARRYAELVRDLPVEERIKNSLVVRQPVGVVACITPWNYPLSQIVHKVIPAIAAGCTVVLKPSEVAPLSAQLLAEVIAASKLPAGVFNLVWGDGPTVGELLASHPGVDMVSFTGSSRAGRRVAELASATIKRLALELGGKSANLILDDADLEKAVKTGVANAFLNSGQTCSAQTRMLVPRSRLAEAEQLALAAAGKFSLGPAQDPASRLGPLVSATQRDRVRNFIQTGIEEGAKLLCGGGDLPADQPRGFFVKPTVFSNVTPQMTIAREEIFGPVLCLVAYDDEAEAIRIANDSDYGLGGGVWSKDQDRAVRVARKLRTGQVDINGGAFNPEAPFGGFKQSGIGREGGLHGLLEFFELQSLQL